MSEYKWPLMKNTITIGDRLRLAKFVLTSDKFTAGPKVKEFEEKWNTWLGSKHSLFVSSGSAANFLLFAAMKEKYGWKNGDKVLVPACTWVTSVSPIIQLGLTPIFCDINLENYSFSRFHLRLIAREHQEIKCVFVTHLLGYSANLEQIEHYFPNAIIAEDVCESHGSMDKNGRKNGTKYAGSFSFYFGHHMTTIEGGMLSTSDSELYDLMKMKRSHGMARESIWFDKYAKENPNIIKSFLFMTDGYNFRNTDLAATLGLSQLKRLDKMIEIRNNNARKYTSLLSPYREMFIMAGYPDHRNSSFAFPFISRNVSIHNNFVKLLQEVKIEYRPIVSGNLLVQPFLKNYSLGLSNPNVNILNERGCYIGNNHFVGRKEFKLLESVLERLCE